MEEEHNPFTKDKAKDIAAIPLLWEWNQSKLSLDRNNTACKIGVVDPTGHSRH